MQNEAYLPSQVAQNEKSSGCRLLILRYFEQAREDYCKNHPACRQGRIGTALYKETEAWLESFSTDFLSFEWVCAHFGWDPAQCRKALRAEAALGKSRIALRQRNAGSGNSKVTPPY